jgi:hypothetical protein
LVLLLKRNFIQPFIFWSRAEKNFSNLLLLIFAAKSNPCHASLSSMQQLCQAKNSARTPHHHPAKRACSEYSSSTFSTGASMWLLNSLLGSKRKTLAANENELA